MTTAKIEPEPRRAAPACRVSPYQLAADCYGRELGWSVGIGDWAVWSTAGQCMEAIDAPQELAVLAHVRLLERDADGPVILVPGRSARWVFVIEPPAARPNHGLLAALAERGAHCLRNRARIELPPTRVPGGELRWIRGPEPGRLPRFSTVAGALIGASLDDPLS